MEGHKTALGVNILQHSDGGLKKSLDLSTLQLSEKLKTPLDFSLLQHSLQQT